MGGFRDLTVYKKAFGLAMQIHQITKGFPKDEIYSLTDQIRGSSRSVAACVGEAYRKRKYPAHFIAKITDADMENSETQVWLDFSLACGYIDQTAYDQLLPASEEVGRLLNHMIDHPENYQIKS